MHSYLSLQILLFLSLFLVDPLLADDPSEGRLLTQKQLKPVFEEDWSSGKIDEKKWYRLQKKWGTGNYGVVPENVYLDEDIVKGQKQNVLICEAHGDRYSGKITGWKKKRSRVGGVIVSKPFFASGKFEVVMKIGDTRSYEGGPENPAHPCGSIPAIWTYSYRWVEGNASHPQKFSSSNPLYNPHIPAYGMAANEYWSELDFPEIGKQGDFSKGLYNTFCQNRHDSQLFDVSPATDGEYHVFTTEWKTQLRPFEDVKDHQVVKHLGYWWIQDESIPFDKYLGNPLKKLGPDQYALYSGDVVTHWIDGEIVGTNRKYVPVMAAQLNLGIWLPEWAGPAPWQTSQVSIASVKVWQYDNPGDVHGVLVDDITNNFGPDGQIIP
ncbi:glycoside hydrolase family 16 protein [Rubinisphaera sp.]|uniref:glycoside hydrolase family 16 protein n=1 Tax=Rubinisphaera sp. TaxID=2024857 RepID=UPI000C0FC9E8|nr:glycoside hydrolase family 16 protein [Rubinisphaera sp.]MBV10360.1 hypothetical protein [Rubinisphaera sp.]HCS51269.1 hypothetical protein [Planctomycetaceae bacterium]|tara:strand:+ start:9098 stop:10237 length:1140 start_codon:yes stop_codon:yes gene_type:complete